ncbi:ABC transporter substrate-binding protein, partial [Chloroflexota bacterium]
PAPEGPIYGGILRTACKDDAPSYDSMTATTTRIQVHTSLVFNGLVRTDPQKADTSVENIVPDLAEKWEISPDGKVYTFSLRQGVNFHDGHPFTAVDVKYSLDKFRDPSTSAFAAGVEPIDRVEIVDDYTVKVYLKHAFPEILLGMTPPYASIQPEHLKDVSTKDAKFLTGTGPFMFESRIPGKISIYKKNPDYFIEGLPYLDAVEVYIMKEPTYIDAFVAGRVDTGGTLRNYLTGIEQISKIKKFAPEAKYELRPDGGYYGVAFNLEKEGPWQDLRVRQAMALVIDYPGAVVAAAGGTPEETGFVAPCGFVDFGLSEAIQQDEVKKLLGIDKPMEERIATAKKLMTEAGYPDGFSTSIICRDSFIHKNPPLLLSDLWKRYLNIDVKVDMLDASLIFDRQSSGQYDLVYVTTGGGVVSELLGQHVTGDYRNNSLWSNAEYDQLFAQILGELDTAKRAELARKTQLILYDELPFIPVLQNSPGCAWRPDLMVGWPAVPGIVMQMGPTNMQVVDRLWMAGTPDAERWIKTQKK